MTYRLIFKSVMKKKIGYIDYSLGKIDNIGIGIGYNRLYRLQFREDR